MDTLLLTLATAGISKAVPALARAMAQWMKSEGSAKITITARDGVEIVDLTPENVKEVLERLAKSSGKVVVDFPRQAVEIDRIEAGRDILIEDPGPLQSLPTETVKGGGGNPESDVANITVTDKPDAEQLKIALVEATLVRMRARLGIELPKAIARYRLSRKIKLIGSIVALVSNVSVLGALGLGNNTASVVAAVIALLVSGLKTIEDYLIAGITGKEPQRLQELVIETNRLWYEAGEIIETFTRLAAVRAPPAAFPLSDANRIAKDLLRLLPEMELTGG